VRCSPGTKKSGQQACGVLYIPLENCIMFACVCHSILRRAVWFLLFFGVVALASAQSGPREFPIGRFKQPDQLPQSRLRQQIEGLPAPAQQRAIQWLQSFHFTLDDLPSLHADAEGGIFYACEAIEVGAVEFEPEPRFEASALPVSPFPASLIFHSRPGAPNVLYLNFSGENVTNTEWNKMVNRSVIPALAFSTDSDRTTFSASEQTAIKRIWQRVAEDFAPFNINVTTERPATFNNRTAHALITRSSDANGESNPYSTSGGVAYVNVFNTISYAKYRPAWVYHDNLGNSESFVAEAASHEIGHNLGLSHDGKTDGTEYYGGHGSGDTSWGPLMGTGFNRQVSHWCKGEYHMANNSQDDLATIAGKISYRADDHGNTPGTATPLVISNGTNVVSTTPENDPQNTSPANKGVLERNTDVDVFSFVTGSGKVRLAINPWIMASGTRGGNLDLSVELYNEAGALLLTNNPPHQTTALVETNLPEGRYFLYVRNTGAGDPFSSTPTGYTAYGSIGQYFISGYVAPSTGFVVPPVAELKVTDLTSAGQGAKQFTVTYSDNVAIDVSTIDSSDIRVIGTNGYDRLARFVSVNAIANGTPRTATYEIDPPEAAVWLPSDNGTYTIWMEGNQVRDIEDAWVAAGQLGQFNVTVPVAIYTANMDSDPGWILEPQWQYGTPAYASSGPKGGFTGTRIIGYNLSGSYENRLSIKYATTPAINCSGSTSVILRFRRWLRLRSGDTAVIQVTTNGTSWANVWSTSSAVSDTSWQEVQYTLPPGVAGSPSVRLRWGIASNPAQNDIGWNIDDVELLGDGRLDTTPPAALLSVGDITMGGSPSHSCSVTYTDDTAVRLASLDSFDLLVLGPNGYSNLVEFVGADLPLDGTPITATYSIPAPNELWSAVDNGVYEVILMGNEVEDIFNNAISETVLGSFTVAISAASPSVLGVTPEEGFNFSGAAGSFQAPPSVSYMLTNSGGITFNWAATKSEDWFELSASSGTLQPGGFTNVTITLNAHANALAPGDHTDTLGFINATTGNGNTTRLIALTITGSKLLLFEPMDFLAAGYQGGPFVPESSISVLTNAGASTMTWTLSHTNWLSVSPAEGTLPGNTATELQIAFNVHANALEPGEHISALHIQSSEGESISCVIRLEVWQYPRLNLARSSEPDGWIIQVVGEPNQTFTLEVSPDMTHWESLHLENSGENGLVEFFHADPINGGRLFYRARAEP
jgi:hypothetical protein